MPRAVIKAWKVVPSLAALAGAARLRLLAKFASVAVGINYVGPLGGKQGF